MMLSFHRQNRMTGVGQQFQYILRDESTHLNFGVDLINGLVSENPELWTPALHEKTSERIARPDSVGRLTPDSTANASNLSR
jgi:ribonucleoside-diphosphate reductase beta chain